MKRTIMALAGSLIAATGGSAAAAKDWWRDADPAPARAEAREVLLVALPRTAQPGASAGECLVEAAVLRAERGRPREPGTPIDFTLPCAGPRDAMAGPGRRVGLAALAAGRLGRLYLGAGGKPVDYEELAATVAAPPVGAEAADRGQLWRLLWVGKRESVLVDTDDVERDGARRTGWMKRSLESDGRRRVVQVVMRGTWDCEARTWALERWYARSSSIRVDSEGIVPESERREVAVAKGSAAEWALRALCAPRR
jgi:hypothetical protein